ncbi:DoxX family protein [Geothrix sp. 21YS21S-4]|uniref:DoxX family protein n=1 Tax=Geothrix sp. 21YS21S-4 TaxID=3068889 RepID=UPI0027B8E574|nr:DoxX family protein [Geothrix sp. 21YS21S-4]
MRALARFAEPAYALLRMMSGLLFAFHGAQKVFGFLADFRPPAGSQLWIGGVIELAGGLALLVGFRTREAAFLCSGTMAIAYAQFHWKFAWGARFWPALNQGELAVVYCFLFLFIACRGAGRWSLDKAE